METRTQENTNIAVVSCFGSSATSHKIAKLAELSGLVPVAVELTTATRWQDFIALPELEDCNVLVISTSALVLLRRPQENHQDQFRTLLERFRAILIYGDSSSSGENSNVAAFAAELNRDFPGPPLEIETDQFRVALSENLPPGCHQLRGLSFMAGGTQLKWRAFPIPENADGHAERLLTAERLPLFVRYTHDNSELFLLANQHILDIDEIVRPSHRNPGRMVTLPYLELLPWLIFFRATFGDAGWHNPKPAACLTIDDPLLRPRYGFLNYQDLLAAAEAYNFTASIAFIPWNCRRSSRETVELIKSHTDRISLCVHGSDHTRDEFAIGDEQALRSKARIALSRMLEHQASTGLGFDRVMVFPQGVFSRAAMRALGAEGFSAAINTSVVAVDSFPEDLTYRDLLDVALVSYGGCPLFSRRYPVDLFHTAFDLFIGKPALLVQHHGDFRNHCEPIANFVRSMNRQDNGLSWRSAAQIVGEAALYRQVGAREQWVRFYTDEFFLENPAPVEMTYRLYRRLPVNARPSMVQRDGAPVDFLLNNSVLSTEFVLAPGEIARVSISPSSAAALNETAAGVIYAAKVASRRLLSEFRDNYLARNQWLLARAQALKDLMRRRTAKEKIAGASPS